MVLWSTGTILSLGNNVFHKMEEGDWNITSSSGLKKLKKQFLYDGEQNILIRTCHFLEYSCLLYTDIIAVETKVSLKIELLHMDGIFMLKNYLERSKKGEPVLVKKETDQNSLIIDCFSVAWKQELKTNELQT